MLYYEPVWKVAKCVIRAANRRSTEEKWQAMTYETLDRKLQIE